VIAERFGSSKASAPASIASLGEGASKPQTRAWSRPAALGPAAVPSEWPVSTVVIDPGHGGPRSGANRHRRLRETDVVLDNQPASSQICCRNRGVRFVMTRPTLKWMST